MERRRFTEEFKREAVKLARQPGASKTGIAKDLGISANMLARWAREQEGKSAQVIRGKGESLSAEKFERMRRELAKVKTERDILKKVLAYFAKLLTLIRESWSFARVDSMTALSGRRAMVAAIDAAHFQMSKCIGRRLNHRVGLARC